MRTTQTDTTEKSLDELIQICKEYLLMIEIITEKFSTSAVLTLASLERTGGET